MCQGINFNEGNIELFFLKCKSLEKTREDLIFFVFVSSNSLRVIWVWRKGETL